MAIVYLGMGSNLGFRLRSLREGVRLLRGVASLIDGSGVMENPAVGPGEQPSFLNLVVKAGVEVAPVTLLHEVKRIERRVGRRPTYRWGPRILDIDLLLYEGVTTQSEELTLPHPRMMERDFVLAPLAEIDPALVERLHREWGSRSRSG